MQSNAGSSPLARKCSLSDLAGSPPLAKTSRRGPADTVDQTCKTKLIADLKTYCEETSSLWDFGEYNDGSVNRHKQPILTSLLLNEKLWKLLLIYFPTGKVRDSVIISALQAVIDEKPTVKHMDCDDELFCVWVAKRIHVQMGHLHDVCNYPKRLTHRLSLLDPDQFKRFQTLIELVHATRQQQPDIAMSTPDKGTRVTTSPSAPSAILVESPSVTGGIPMMFAGPASSPSSTTQPLTRSPLAAIPTIFKNDDDAPMELHALTARALSTPPLPSKRGGIREACERASGQSSPADTTLRISLTTAKTGGSPRTYLLVNKKYWCQTLAKRHVDHKQIMHCLADCLRHHRWSKDQCKAALDLILASWPNMPDLAHV